MTDQPHDHVEPAASQAPTTPLPVAAPDAPAPDAPGQAPAAPFDLGAALAASAVPPPSVTHAAPRRRGWRVWAVRSVVTLVMLALVGVSAYLVVVSRQWSDRVDELTAVSQDLGQQVADERAAKESAQAAADDVQSQLDTLKARVTDLANSEANAVDQQDTLSNYLDAMIDCADQRGRLIADYGSLWTSGGRTITSRQYGAELTTYCNDVKSTIKEFRAEVGG